MGPSPLHVRAARAEADQVRVVDPQGTEVIDRAECLHLLATHQVGRLGLVRGSEPLILPVNYWVDGDSIVFRTAPGTKLSLGDGSPACFQIDELDPVTRSGWSVLAVGRLEEITDYDHPDVRRLRDLPLSSWAGDDGRRHWMRLITRRLTGRRVSPGPVRSG